MSDDLIVSTPGTLGGVPRFAGTRIPVAMVQSLIADGYDDEGIAAFYPSVTPAHVEAARERMSARSVRTDLG